METDHRSSLEQALAKTEAEAEAACKAATAALRTLKKFRTAAQTGNLRELQKAIETAGQTLADLERQFTTAAAAAQVGVHIHERDDRLYCYPSLIRVLVCSSGFTASAAAFAKKRGLLLWDRHQLFTLASE